MHRDDACPGNRSHREEDEFPGNPVRRRLPPDVGKEPLLILLRRLLLKPSPRRVVVMRSRVAYEVWNIVMGDMALRGSSPNAGSSSGTRTGRGNLTAGVFTPRPGDDGKTGN